MDPRAVAAERRRSRNGRNKAIKVKITHSEIMNRRTGVSGLRVFGETEKYKGGYRNLVSTTSAFKVYNFNLPAQGSTGEFKVASGCMTFIMDSGIVIVQYMERPEKKGDKPSSKNYRISNGESISVEKGDVVRFATAGTPATAILILSKSFKTEKISDPLFNDTGMQQFLNARGNDVRTLKTRKPKSPEERIAFAAKLEGAAGRSPSRHAGKPVAGNNDIPATVQGINPTPIYFADE